MKLILFCRVLASLRRQKISMILQIALHTDQISVLGGIVVPVADVGCQKKCSAMVKVGLSQFQKLIGKRISQKVLIDKMSGKFHRVQNYAWHQT